MTGGSFNETYDVVVVGFGAAGTAAAITASDADASVVLVEKCPEHRHTPSARMSGGMVMTVTDVEAGARYLDVCASGMVPYDVSHAWAERAAGLMEWFDEVVGASIRTLRLERRQLRRDRAGLDRYRHHHCRSRNSRGDDRRSRSASR